MINVCKHKHWGVSAVMCTDCGKQITVGEPDFAKRRSDILKDYARNKLQSRLKAFDNEVNEP